MLVGGKVGAHTRDTKTDRDRQVGNQKVREEKVLASCSLYGYLASKVLLVG